MKKVVIVIIGLLALFSILRASAEESPTRLNLHPGTIEFADQESEITIGFGLIESAGEKSMVWNIFPVKISLRAGNMKFYLAMNGLSFLTASGINFTKPLVITGNHQGDVISFGGPVTVKGRVLGDVWVFGTDVVLNSGAEIVGNVVALGGGITKDRRANITGNKYSLPELKIPFIGLLSSSNSIQHVRFYLEIFQVGLFLLLLFLGLYFREENLKSQTQTLFQHWKGALVFILVSVVLIPLLLLFLVASVYGIIFIPVLLLFVMYLAYFGFIAFTLSLGKLFLKQEKDTLGHYYLCGLLGVFLLKGPAILGIFLALFNVSLLTGIGNFFSAIGSVAVFIAFLYGFGVSLVNLRSRS